LLYMQKVGCLLGCHLKKSYSKISILKLWVSYFLQLPDPLTIW
jgi:hypothetical protein